MVTNEVFEKLLPEARRVAKLIQDAKLTSKCIFPFEYPTNLFQASVACCGLMELNTVYWTGNDYFFTAEQLKVAGKGPSELEELNLVYQLYTFAPNRYGRGYMFWCGPPTDKNSRLLKRIGFTKVVSFANPNHRYHEVEMLGCHTPRTSNVLHAKGVSWWDAVCGTKDAKNAEAETMSGSTTTEASSASDATGGVYLTTQTSYASGRLSEHTSLRSQLTGLGTIS